MPRFLPSIILLGLADGCIAAARTRKVAGPGGVAGHLTHVNGLLLVARPGKKRDDRSHESCSAASAAIVRLS